MGSTLRRSQQHDNVIVLQCRRLLQPTMADSDRKAATALAKKEAKAQAKADKIARKKGLPTAAEVRTRRARLSE